MNKMMNAQRFFKMFIVMPIVFVAFIALGGWVVMLLWNAIIPDVFPMLPAIDYWHALGLLALSKILFGHFGKRYGGHYGRHKGRFARHMKHKWMNMSEEERQKFKEDWKKCRT